jgi:hypothetical protein
MDPKNEKRQAFDRAKKALGSGDADDLRYVALELRRCLEAIVYQKLWAYRDRLPIQVARKWQPPQAFRALLLFEPNADKTRELRFARQEGKGILASGPLTALGTELGFSAQWLTKTYNKLGSYLHATWPFAKNPSASPLDQAEQFLRKTIDELEPYVANNTFFSMAEVVEFTCVECGTSIKANAFGIERERRITCLNPACECEHIAEPNGSGFDFYPDTYTAECPACASDIRLLPNKTKVGHVFSCRQCHVDYIVTEQQWSFEKANEHAGSE